MLCGVRGRCKTMCPRCSFRRIFFVYLAHIIGFATANRPAGDFRYYVSPNMLCIFGVFGYILPKNDPESTSFNTIAIAQYLKTHYLCTCKNDTSRDGAVVARWAHNPKVGGSSPPPATKKESGNFFRILFSFPPSALWRTSRRVIRNPYFRSQLWSGDG